MYKEETILEPARRLGRSGTRQRRPTRDLAKKTMKAVAMDRFGPPSVLKLRELRLPEPAPNEVQIALHAAGVGVWDADIRKGWWPEGKPKFPLVLGTDGAGIVSAKGARVRRFNVGDRVWAYEFINPKGGFYAEYVVVNSEHVARVPRRLDLLEAGAAAVTGLTALQGIDDQLRVRANQTVMVFGASGALGTLAVQFAKRRRARVIGIVRGRDAAALVRHLGAYVVLDARSDDSVERLRDLAPHGIDAVLALAGGESLERFLDLVHPGGRVAYPNGVEPEPRRRPKVRLISYDGKASREHFAKLAHAVEEAKLQVPIVAVYPLAHAAKAHQRIGRGHVLGRVVLQIRRDQER